MKNIGYKAQYGPKKHGGKRKGAGAKPKPDHLKKEPTKVIRVPISKISQIQDILKK